MPPQKPKVGFLSLSLETRLRIYDFLLVCEPQVRPSYKPPAERTLTPSVLRTCKQIHSEASPVLYSENMFLIAEPDRILKWLTQIGQFNTKHLRSLHINVHAVYSTKDRSFWCKLLDHLAQEVTRLRHLEIYWDAEPTCNHYGAGRDLCFVRNLAKFPKPQSMKMDGFYARHWSGYLAEKMGARIEEKDLAWVQYLREYQRGTENLIP